MAGRKQQIRSRNKDGDRDTDRDEEIFKKIGRSSIRKHSNHDRRFSHGLLYGMEFNLKTLLFSLALALSIIAFVIFYYYRMDDVNTSKSLRVITPLPVPKLMDLPLVNSVSMCTYLFLLGLRLIFVFVFPNSHSVLLAFSLKANTGRVCIGVHIAHKFIWESVPGATYFALYVL